MQVISVPPTRASDTGLVSFTERLKVDKEHSLKKFITDSVLNFIATFFIFKFYLIFSLFSVLLKGAMSRFVHLEKFSLNFSSSSFAIRVNLLHLRTSLFPFSSFLPLWCLSTLANYYLKVSFLLTIIFNDPKKQLKIS